MRWECRWSYSIGDSEVQYVTIQDFRKEPEQIGMLNCKETETGRIVIFSF